MADERTAGLPSRPEPHLDSPLEDAMAPRVPWRTLDVLVEAADDSWDGSWDLEPGQRTMLVLTKTLRYLPGRRLVALVESGSRPGMKGLLKIFMGAGADRHRTLEVAGLRRMALAGMRVPEVTARVATEDRSALGVVVSYFEDAEPLVGDTETLIEVADMLGRLNDGGYVHGDPHLDNFLLVDGHVHGVDGSSIRRRWLAALRRGPGLGNLAALLAEIPPRHEPNIRRILKAYGNARSWSLDAGELTRLARQLDGLLLRRRRAQVNRYVRKSQRTCTEFLRQRSWRQLVLCRRDCWSEAMAGFFGDPEAVCRDAVVLKSGNSATVVRTKLGGRSVVIKRYNIKGFMHRLRRWAQPVSRARWSWRNGHRLTWLDIPTARPLALLENRTGPLSNVCYLVLDDLGDVHLDGVIRQDVARWTVAAAALFAELKCARLVHGDTKVTNFMIKDGTLHLVDLDSMRERQRGFEASIARFRANFPAEPEICASFEAALARCCERGRVGVG